MTAEQSPVHGLWDRLTGSFGARQQAGVRELDHPEQAFQDDPQSLDGLLAAALVLTGWTGSPRQIAEAKPHLADISSADQLRAVLFRLGVQSVALETGAGSIQREHLPALVLAPDNAVLLALDCSQETITFIAASTPDLNERDRSSVSGQVFLLRLKSVEFDPDRPRESWIGRLSAHFIPDGFKLLMLSCGVNILGLTGALFAMAIYDFAIASRAMDTLAFLFAGAAGCIGLEFILRRARSVQIAKLVARMDALVATAIYARVLQLPLAMTDSAGLETQLARFRQFRIGRTLFTGNIASAMLDAPFSILALGLVWFLGGAIVFVPVAIAAVLGILFMMAGPAIASRTKQTSELKSKSDSLLVEIATKHETICDAGLAQVLRARAAQTYLDYLIARFRSQKLEATLQAWSQALLLLAGIGVLGLGAVRVIDQTLTVGAMIAMMAVVWRVLVPVQTVCLSWHRIQQIVSVLRQVDRLMGLATEAGERQAVLPSRSFSGSVRLKDVSFRYPSRQNLALRGVNLDVPAGTLVAVTGANGAGKSTLLKVILGLYHPQAGRVTIDGAELRQIDAGELRQAASYLPQDPVLFYGTIAQNVRLGAPDAADAEVRAPLARFGIGLPNALLPDGLETRVRGWIHRHSAAAFLQRVALAGAFIRERPIILLDCPSQHLDSDGDRDLLAALAGMAGRATVFIVTQRPSHMAVCHRVLLMSEGEIIAQGEPSRMIPKVLAHAQTPRPAVQSNR